LLFAYLQKPVLLKPVSLVLERMMLFAFSVVVEVANVTQQEAVCDTYLAGAAAMLMLMLMLMHPILQFVSRASCYHLFVTAVGEAVVEEAVAVVVVVVLAQAQVEV
jgi:hypothetical protein